MLPLIECKALSKKYDRQKQKDAHALKHINLKIEKGDILGIIGFSGAGKSTLLRCLATLEKPSFGQIYLSGQEITQLNAVELQKLRRSFGMVFQNFNLFSGKTVWENIAYPLQICKLPKEEIGLRVSEFLALVNLSEHKNAYPAQLSGGQKQRVGIARALVNYPKILFCDEPTSALDPYTTQEILALLQKVQKQLDLTVVIVTHEMEVVKQVCTKVAVLDQGEVAETGKIVDVFMEPKHLVTKKLAQRALPEIPLGLISGRGRVFHLHFKGDATSKPLITQMARKYGVDVNILLGWIDVIQSTSIGNLVVEMTGEDTDLSIAFLKNQSVFVEEIGG